LNEQDNNNIDISESNNRERGVVKTMLAISVSVASAEVSQS